MSENSEHRLRLMPQKVSPSRLQRGAATLFGREMELARLDEAWLSSQVRIVTLVARGGVGKTSLVGKWVATLADRDFDGADYFDWSFYSQGTRDHAPASADTFVDTALRFFGDEETANSAKGPWDKGARLAELIGRRRTLLVLDGLEPLQQSSRSPLTGGELHDPAIKALLRDLAGRNAGLCVVTTRMPLPDLGNFRERATHEWSLEGLSIPAGAALLSSLGVLGAKAEIDQLLAEVKGHALTLSLIGSYLRDAHHGDIRRRDLFRLGEADEEKGGQAISVIAAYERFFEAQGEQGRRHLAILRLLGLFDRPARADLLSALRHPPELSGLTQPFFQKSKHWRGWFKAHEPIEESLWRSALIYLVKSGLIEDQEGMIDAHPLIRGYFGQQLRKFHPAAWRAAHGRLFDHLKNYTEHQPITLAGLQPLYQAVYHGCEAGRQQEACDEVYVARIRRGSDFYSKSMPGAYGADLGALVCFFEAPWGRVSPSLAPPAQAWLLNQAGFCLRGLGRLAEAVEAMRAGLEKRVLQEDWKQAAASASYLSQLELTLGEVWMALADAERSISFSERSGDAFQQVINHAMLAEARHQAGDDNETALVLFRKAEALQAEMQPHFPLLFSRRGFQYCDLLLAPVELAAATRQYQRHLTVDLVCADVEARAANALTIAKLKNSPLDAPLHHLTLGRVLLYRMIGKQSLELRVDAWVAIEQAVAGMRAHGQLDDLPRALLTRAWLRRIDGGPEGARADLDEAEEIAELGSMKLHLADIALYRARLFGDRAALTEAKSLVEKCGYGRRRTEIKMLEQAWQESGELEVEMKKENTDSTSSSVKRFRVALSFPGEHRPFVAGVATRLAEVLGPPRVLYDAFYEAEFARPDLDTYLQRLYHEESELIVIFLCADYDRKDWCRLEWRAIRDLIKRRQSSSVMPVKFDDTEIPGLFSVDGYVWVGKREPAEIAGLILERLGMTSASPLATALGPTTSLHTQADFDAQSQKSTPRKKSKAIAIWQEKLEFLEMEQAIAVEADAKFRLAKQIEEARRKIHDLGGDDL